MSSIFPFDESAFENVGVMPTMPDIPLDSIEKVRDLENGDSVYQIGGKPDTGKKSKAEQDFYANLAEDLQDTVLEGIASKLLEDIKQDRESRSDWENTINLAMKYLGFKIEEFRKAPYIWASNCFDSTLSTALIQFYSIARAELFPALGPAKSEIIGVPTQETEDEGERVKMFINYYLTQIDRDYYSDSERLLMYVGFFGCAFRKVYQDPILNRPLARLITPQDFIINNHTTSVMTSDRMTQVMYLNRKEIMLRQKSGDFIDIDLPDTDENKDDEMSAIDKNVKRIEGISSNDNENKTLFKFYEVHVDLDRKDIEPKDKGKKKKGSIPRPYIVTICDANRKIMSIRRNWREGDDKYTRLEYFVHYSYSPGFGIYGLGLAQLMGSNAIVLTSILRQTIDAGSLKNFPGGVRQKGSRFENNNVVVGPSEFPEIETGGRPIQECLMLMPYGEPSQALIGLRETLKQETAAVPGASEMQLPEVGTNTPVGTTLAMLEVATRVQSSVLRSLHVSLAYELKLLFNLFGEYLEEEPYPFAVPGANMAIMKKDFSDKINIVPVSDPNVMTSTHRILRAETLLKLAQSAPEIHNLKEAYRRMYSSMNIENIDKILLPDEKPMPLDPVSENMNAILGKPLMVAPFQDDEAHNMVHRKFLNESMQNPQLGNPQLLASLTLHIQNHEANKLLKQLQQQMPMEVPPEQVMMIPELQNMLAHQDAMQAQQDIEAQQEQMRAQQQAASHQLDPNAVMMADIDQHREAAYLKNEESKLRAETEAFKAQLKFEGDTEKLEAEKEMAEDKHEVVCLLPK
jgi:hypothetical protein